MKKPIISLLLIFITLFSFEIYSQDNWVQLNGPFGGVVNRIVSSPNGTLFAISHSAVFKSTNEGTEWSQVTPPSINNITSGGVAPNGFIYITTGNFNSQIFRSTNQGVNWEEVLPDGGYDFNDITITPGGIILAGTSYMFSFHGQFIQSGNIYRSINNGSSFSLVSFPDLAIQSISANTNGDIYVATTNGLFKSVDGGSGWGIIRNDTCSKVFTAVTGQVFLQTRGQVLRSTDNGGSWQVVNSRMPMASTPNEFLFTAEGGKIYRSADFGNSWTQIALISPSQSFYTNAILATGNSKLYSGSDVGIHKSINGGFVWEEANSGIRISNIKSVVSKGNVIFTGSDNYISRSTNNGSSWTNLTNGLPDIGAYKLMINANGSVLALINGVGVFRSDNNGDTWTELSLTDSANTGMIEVNTNSDIFAASSENIFKSTNNGNSWTIVNNGLPTDQPLITGISIDKLNNLYASLQWGGFNTEHGLFKSTNGGASWTQISNQNITADFKFTSNGNIYCIFATRLMLSTNGGVNFSLIGNTPEYCIELEIGNLDQIFLHYVDNGIYGIKKSTNNAQSWSDFTQGLGQLLVYDFQFDNNSFLLAATQSGLFRTTNTTLGITNINTDLPTEYSLSQNYPNPFNPETKIQFSLPQNKHIRLAVFNTIGKEVALLVNGFLNSGTYEYSWDASGYASGVYFYKLESENFSHVKKMILLK